MSPDSIAAIHQSSFHHPRPIMQVRSRIARAAGEAITKLVMCSPGWAPGNSAAKSRRMLIMLRCVPATGCGRSWKSKSLPSSHASAATRSPPKAAGEASRREATSCSGRMRQPPRCSWRKSAASATWSFSP